MAELEAKAAEPDFWNNQNQAKDIINKTNAIRSTINPYLDLVQAVEDAQILLELVEGEAEDGARGAYLREIEDQLSRAEKDFERVELQSLLNGELDSHNVYVSLHAGAGGTESCDWADMLFRMYTRYAESHGFKYEILDYLPGDEAGIKNVTILISGPFAYGYLKSERGVHRLVRISPFDSNKRRHTSFVALDAIAEVDDDIDVVIDDKDLRVDTYRSSGAGGQHVNKTDSAVRLTHLPTGIVVACQAERSQHRNKDTAMKMLKAKVYELEQDKQRAEMEKFYGEKGEMAWGRQIRSYVMQPYKMVKDHRTDVETGNVDAVMDGDLDKFIEGYLKKAARKE